MILRRPPRAVWLMTAALTAGCGAVEYPTAPSRDVPDFYVSSAPPVIVDRSGPSPAPELPPTVPALAGGWSGLLRFTESGVMSQFFVIATVTQAGRDVVASWRTDSGSFLGEVRGTLEGVGGDSRLVGRLTFSAPSSSPSVRCNASGAIRGQAYPDRVWWEAPAIVLSNCAGDVANLRLTFTR